MHYLSSVYSVTILLHVSGLLVSHNQEVTMYICDNTYQLSHIYIVTSWWWDTSKPETCRSIVTEQTEDKYCIRLVSLHVYVEMHGQQNTKKLSTVKFKAQSKLVNFYKAWRSGAGVDVQLQAFSVTVPNETFTVLSLTKVTTAPHKYRTGSYR
jgi:hypothetical protein